MSKKSLPMSCDKTFETTKSLYESAKARRENIAHIDKLIGQIEKDAGEIKGNWTGGIFLTTSFGRGNEIHLPILSTRLAEMIVEELRVIRFKEQQALERLNTSMIHGY